MGRVWWAYLSKPIFEFGDWLVGVGHLSIWGDGKLDAVGALVVTSAVLNDGNITSIEGGKVHQSLAEEHVEMRQGMGVCIGSDDHEFRCAFFNDLHFLSPMEVKGDLT